MKIKYIFSKDPVNSTYFDIIRTKYSSDEFRTLILKKSDDSKSDKFKDLQFDDVLILKEDLFNKSHENLVIVTNITSIDNGVVEVTLKGYSKSMYEIDEYEDDEDQLIVLARVDKHE